MALLGGEKGDKNVLVRVFVWDLYWPAICHRDLIATLIREGCSSDGSRPRGLGYL